MSTILNLIELRDGSARDIAVVDLLMQAAFEPRFGEAWTETIAILSKEGYRVIVPDQIGFGRSSKPILHYSISTHASNTKRLLDSLGIKVTDMVTHSMGGMVASRFASSYPEAVANLAMINQIGLTDARSGRPWRELRIRVQP